MILKIVKYPDPILHRKAQPVKTVTPEMAKLMDDMAETMYADAGVGLAAPQVGVSKRIITIDVGIDLQDGSKKSQLIQIANPEIISKSGTIEWEDGCLSIPEFRLKTKRYAKIVVKGLGKNNRNIELIAEGLLSVAFQHEIDHLAGKLLIDNISKEDRERYLKDYNKASTC